MKKVCVCVGGGWGLKSLSPRKAWRLFLLSFLNGQGIALMGSLQITTGSALRKVVHAVGLWP